MIPIKRLLREKSGRLLLVFNHGVGDFILFLPVFEEMKRQFPQLNISIGAQYKRGFEVIYPDIVCADFPYVLKQFGLFDYVYEVHYPNAIDQFISIADSTEPAKPYLAAYYEFGMSPFEWAPYKLAEVRAPFKNVGVHFFGHTGEKEKNCSQDVAEAIWDEIIEAGYTPFEIHMRPQLRNEYLEDLEGDSFKYATEDNSLRFQNPDLGVMRDAIRSCTWFIGVDSGPLYMSTAILGQSRLIGLENEKRIHNFIPIHFNTVSIKEYKKGSIKQLLLENK